MMVIIGTVTRTCVGANIPTFPVPNTPDNGGESEIVFVTVAAWPVPETPIRVWLAGIENVPTAPLPKTPTSVGLDVTVSLNDPTAPVAETPVRTGLSRAEKEPVLPVPVTPLRLTVALTVVMVPRFAGKLKTPAYGSADSGHRRECNRDSLANRRYSGCRAGLRLRLRQY